MHTARVNKRTGGNEVDVGQVYVKNNFFNKPANSYSKRGVT
jgi:hypothetical protein